MVALGIAMLTGGQMPPVKLVMTCSKTELPFERITGLSVSGDKWVVGSMRGLYIGSPSSSWKEVTGAAVRQVVSDSRATWVLYGSGSVDKLDVKNDRMYYDVFTDAVKRPWASSVGRSQAKLMFGGFGGWFERDGQKAVAEFYPPILEGKSVTALAASGRQTYVGTQDGLVLAGRNPKRLGFGDGLADVWITSLVALDGTLKIGTYSGGLYSLSDSKLSRIETPSDKVRSMMSWNGKLVLGTLEGCWIRSGKGWQQLTTGETTFVESVGSSLVVGTVDGVSFFGS